MAGHDTMSGMLSLSWDIHRWKEILEVGGTAAAILFTGLALRVDARVRRAETLIELNKQHRELWMAFLEKPSLAGLMDAKRDMSAHPLTDEEVRFTNFLVNHLRVTFYADKAGVYIQPQKLGKDIREFFALPAAASAWEKVKASYDDKFVAFVERYRSQPPSAR